MVKYVKRTAYDLRKNRISSYIDRNKQYNDNLSRAIKLSKLETKRRVDLTDLNTILSDRGLRTVEVEGDGNCFFRVIAHQMYGDSSLHQVVRARAVEQVVNNIQMFIGFIEKKKIDDFVDSLSTNREWADNLAVQAVTDAYGVTLEVINSDQQRYGTRIIHPRGDHTTNRQLVIAHVEQIHFMSTEIAFPFETATWGGNLAEETFLTNTCPVDGPLSWLMLSLAYFPKLMNFIKILNIPEICKVYELFQTGRYAEAKMHWLKTIAKVAIPSTDCHGSEAEQFFEPLGRTKLACHPPIKMSEDTLITRIESIPISTSGTSKKSAIDFLPFVFIPKDFVREDDEIPTMVILKGTIFILMLITLYQSEKQHFESYFRFNSKFWIHYDGIEKKKEKIVNHPKFSFSDLGFIVFVREDMLTGNDVYSNELIQNANLTNKNNDTLIKNGELLVTHTINVHLFFIVLYIQ